MSTRVLILGAGFGGLELASRLSDQLADEVHVTLIDQDDAFIFGFAKLDVMFGRTTPDGIRHHYRDITKPSVEFRQETVLSIDPKAKSVVTNGGRHETDVLVIALGADLDPAATPGLIDAGHEFYSPAGAARSGEILDAFEGGAIVVAVLGGFFKCPPAPYETAFMLHDFLERRGLRGASSIHIITPMPMPIPISKDVSGAILGLLEERGIAAWHSSLVTHIDPKERVAHLKDERSVPFDLLLGVPVHRAPQVVDRGRLGADRRRLDPGRRGNPGHQVPRRIRHWRRNQCTRAPSRRHCRR